MRSISLGQPLGSSAEARLAWAVAALKKTELASNENFALGVPIKPITGLTDIKNVQEALEHLVPGGIVIGSGGLTRFQAAVDTGASSVFVRPGTYDLTGGTLTLPTTLKRLWAIPGTVTLTDAAFTATGTVGSEVELASAVARGATSLPFATSGFAAGDWLHVMSCINAMSTDAGADQLGLPQVGTDGTYLAEFQQIRVITDGSNAAMARDMLFAYSDTPGADSGARTASTVRKVTFHDGCTVSGFIFDGKGANDLFNLTWCRDFWLEDCHLRLDETANVSGQFLQMDRCLGGGVRFCTSRRYAYDGVIAVSTYSTVVTTGCQDPSVVHCELAGGGQLVDFTWNPNDFTIACPTINGVCEHNFLRNASEGATTHGGCYGGSLSYNIVEDCKSGIRARSRGVKHDDNKITKGGTAQGFGIEAGNGFLQGCTFNGNIINGFLIGMNFLIDNTEGVAPIPGRAMVANNQITNCTSGIIVERDATDALICTIDFATNFISNFSNKGIYIDSYCNGIIIKDNTLSDPSSGATGIEWEKNISYLTIGTNYFVNFGAENTLVGPGTSTAIDDLTAFPNGNADAHWHIAEQIEIGPSGGTASIITNDSSVWASTVGRKGIVAAGGFRIARTAGDSYTIAAGVVTIKRPGSITVDTEAAAATDDLDTISGGVTGDILVVRSASSTRDPTLKDGTGNLLLAGDFLLSNTADRIVLEYNGTSWVEWTRSDNS